jgi:hypothetical protein
VIRTHRERECVIEKYEQINIFNDRVRGKPNFWSIFVGSVKIAYALYVLTISRTIEL